jgi:predicted ATP-dependent Lon-type protease
LSSFYQDSIRKTAAGMLKLLHPHLTAGDAAAENLREILDFSVEMRKRVVDQLALMKPTEFRDISFEFRLT